MISKEFNLKSPPLPVLRKELEQTLRWFRSCQNKSEIDVDTKMQALMRGEMPGGRFADSVMAQRYLARGFDAIEEGGDGFVLVSYADLKWLAECYEVHRLLLDPLLAAPIEAVCLKEQFDEFLTIGEPTDITYGRGAVYRTPVRKLAHCDKVAVVALTIQPGGRSDSHWHAGEEFMFVRRGSVDVLLRHTGMRARLSQNDYVHFYAEQEHCAFNPNREPAELFIIRFRPATRRLELLKNLRAKSPSQAVLRRAVREVVAALAPAPAPRQPQAGNEMRPVLDRHGLGHFLQLLCSAEFRGPAGRLTLDELAERAAAHGFQRSKLQRLHTGLAPVNEQDLLKLAVIYDVEPVLLFDFLMPVLRGSIVVRQVGDPELQPEMPDLQSIPATFLNPANASYRIARKRLADTDVTIAFVSLSAGGSATVENSHPGSEILLPLQGAVRLTFEGTVTEIPAEFNGFAHFLSHQRHQIVNPGHVPATLLVIRIFD